MNTTETKALNAIDFAVAQLRARLSTAHGSENTRDYLKEFYKSTIDAMASIADANGADALAFEYDTDTVLQSFDDAFMDAIEAEERAEPRIDNRQYSTMNVVNGRVS